MKRFTLAIALAIVLSGVARAGEIPTTGVVTPPPTTTQSTSTTTSGITATIILSLLSLIR